MRIPYQVFSVQVRKLYLQNICLSIVVYLLCIICLIGKNHETVKLVCIIMGCLLSALSLLYLMISHADVIMFIDDHEISGFRSNILTPLTQIRNNAFLSLITMFCYFIMSISYLFVIFVNKYSYVFLFLITSLLFIISLRVYYFIISSHKKLIYC